MKMTHRSRSQRATRSKAAPATAGKVHAVQLGNGFYAPAKKTIRQGDKVKKR